LVIDKPIGLTSHDVVDRIRRLAGVQRVGHAGTLDPLASGVLVVGIGPATRLLSYLQGHDKGYLARLRLGMCTDTYDAEGMVVYEHAGPLPSLEQVEAALERFRGEIEHIPPAFSAVKQGGEPLYRRARRGEPVRPAPRRVHIYSLEVREWEPPYLSLAVECSTGTYIRSLAQDIGRQLGCGAFLAGLIRTHSGPFRLEEAHPLDELERDAAWRRFLLPMELAVAELDALVLDEEESRRVLLGGAIEGPAPAEDTPVRAYAADGRFLALLRYDSQRALWRPQKVFAAPEQ